MALPFCLGDENQGKVVFCCVGIVDVALDFALKKSNVLACGLYLRVDRWKLRGKHVPSKLKVPLEIVLTSSS